MPKYFYSQYRQDGSEVRYASVRFDSEQMPAALRAKLRPPRQEPGGAWIVDGIAATAGVKEYPWGRELAPWSALKEHVALYQGLRLAERHPGVVTSSTPKDNHDVVLTAEALDDVEAIRVTVRVDELPFDKPGLSVGYHPVRVDQTPGERNGEKYDAVQSELKPNHIAKTRSPRSKGSGVRLDDKGKKMAKVTIAGVEFDIDPAAAIAYQQESANRQARLDEQCKATEAAKAEAAAEKAARKMKDGEIAALKALRVDESEINKRVAERADLLSVARRALGDKERFDGKSNDEIKAAIVKKATGLEMDGAELAGAYKAIKPRLDSAASSVESEIDGEVASGGKRQDSSTVTGALKSAPLDGKWLKGA